MKNKEIAKKFQLLGNIMDLHGENKFKIRSYQNAYITLRKLDQPLAEMSEEELNGIKGVGKAIAGKIRELLDTGKMNTLERYKDQTPKGIQEMLGISGFGPKKVRDVWKGLGVETVGELLYAANENRLIELKGFGKKTQDELKQKLDYYLRSKDDFHYASLEAEGNALKAKLEALYPGVAIEFTGAFRRRNNVLRGIELIIGQEVELPTVMQQLEIEPLPASGKGTTANQFPIRLYTSSASDFGTLLFKTSGSPDFLQAFNKNHPLEAIQAFSDEQQLFDALELPYIAPELRESDWALELAQQNQLPALIQKTDIKGVIHAHSTYSDGLNSLRDMALATQKLGYEYLGITDHSKSAFYANGLQPERVIAQMEEIDQLNQELAPFKIFKGIESDILNDGSLDYEDDLLAKFDFIIASVHSNLRMDEAKATQRLVKAIENPYTTILGHPTGRLLLSRKGYPIDHKMVIDACAANQVAIELNANPYRLDLDWTWIPYAIEKEVFIAINPDAHSIDGIEDIHYGVLSARKGGLSAQWCLNAVGVEEFGRRLKVLP